MSENHIMKMHDLPQDERPREKFIQRGPDALTDAELLAIFLRTGTRKKSVMETARYLLREYGSLASFAQSCRHPNELVASKIPGIGLSKACELCAAIELANRIRQGAREVRIAFNDARTVWEAFATDMMANDREVLKLVMMDTRNRLLRETNISVGSLSSCIAHPREVFRPVLFSRAHSIIVLHNHPSGDPSPSQSDHALTRQLRDGAKTLDIRFLDHIIIGSAEGGRQPYFSFREANLL